MSKVIVKVLDQVLVPRFTYYEFSSKKEAIKAIREYDEGYSLPDKNELNIEIHTDDWEGYDWSDTDIYLDGEVVSAYDCEGKCNEWDETVLGERHDNS